MPRTATASSAIWRCRSVSIRSGRRLFTVTLSTTTSRATAFMTPVRPARAPIDGVISGCGDLTMALVMLTIRPKCRARIPGRTPWTNSMAPSMLAWSASAHASAVTSVKTAGDGPALLVTSMSGSGQASSTRRRPSGVERSATTPRASIPKRSAMSRAASVTDVAWRPLTTPETPSAANASAPARPSPRVDAHTRAVRPQIPRSTSAPRGRPGRGQVVDVSGQEEVGIGRPGLPRRDGERVPVVPELLGVPHVVVSDLVHVGEQLEHPTRRVEQVPEEIGPEHVPADAVHGRSSPLGEHLHAGQADGVDVIRLHCIVVHAGDRGRHHQEVVVVGRAPQEAADPLVDYVGHLEPESVPVEGDAPGHVGGAEYDVAHPAGRGRFGPHGTGGAAIDPCNGPRSVHLAERWRGQWIGAPHLDDHVVIGQRIATPQRPLAE